VASGGELALKAWFAFAFERFRVHGKAQPSHFREGWALFWLQCCLFDVADLATLEGNLHVFVDVDLLGAEIDDAGRLAHARRYLIDRLPKGNGGGSGCWGGGGCCRWRDGS
jgi:hypothetical protein